MIQQENKKVICCFASLKNETPKSTNEKMFTCVHGKILSWETARKYLGLST